jgi:hypothetical protein
MSGRRLAAPIDRSAGLQADLAMLPGSARTSVLLIAPPQGFAAPRSARP